MKTAILLAAASCLLLVVCDAQARRPQPVSKDTAAVAEGGNAFGFDLYARLAEKKGNLFFSPSSIHTALAMTYAGARGDTASQMAGTLHYELEGRRLHPAFSKLIQQLNNPRLDREKKPAYELIVSNALWGQRGYPFRDSFTNLAQASYEAGLEQMDFARQPEPSRVRINDWVAEKTRQKIKDLIPPGCITPLTRLVLTNAIYFKSNWAQKFQKRATRDEAFRLAPGRSVRAPMMRQQKRHRYMESSLLQALELPYRFHDLSMVVLLPRKVAGLAAVEKALGAKALAGWLAQLRPVSVEVTLPKFKYTSQFELAPTLKSMGMADAFSGRADFSGMTTAEKLFISNVIHKAFVAVDEEGTEAAAATAVIMRATGMIRQPERPKVFKADHPFLFLIRHRASGAILFVGRVADPTKS